MSLSAFSAYCSSPLRKNAFRLGFGFMSVTDDVVHRVVFEHIAIDPEIDIWQHRKHRSAQKDHPGPRRLEDVEEKVRQLGLEDLGHAGQVEDDDGEVVADHTQGACGAGWELHVDLVPVDGLGEQLHCHYVDDESEADGGDEPEASVMSTAVHPHIESIQRHPKAAKSMPNARQHPRPKRPI